MSANRKQIAENLPKEILVTSEDAVDNTGLFGA